MFSLIPRASESLSTNATNKRVFTAIYHLVLSKIGKHREHFQAILALVWAITCMCAKVISQHVAISEHLRTMLTLVCLFTVVCATVPYQTVLTLKCPLATVACIRFYVTNHHF